MFFTFNYQKYTVVEVQNRTLDVENLLSGLYILNFEFETNNYQLEISLKQYFFTQQESLPKWKALVYYKGRNSYLNRIL